MSKTIVVTEEFDNEGRLVKRITTTETSDTYTPYAPKMPWYPYISYGNDKTYITS